MQVKEKVERSKIQVRSQVDGFDRELGKKIEGPVSEEEEVISVHRFETEPAKVTVDYGLTLNLGNYESARIGVAVSIPCYVEEVDRTYEKATDWAAKRIMQERDDIIDSLKDSKRF